MAVVPEREITEWDEFTGRLEAVDQVEIRPRVSGYIKRVAFAEGQEVKKGEVLFEIDPRPYQADLARAEAELERARSAAALAESEVQRAGKLVDVAGDLPGGVRQPDQRRGPGRRDGAGRGGRGADRPAQPGVDPGPLSDRRPGEQRAGDGGQSGRGGAAGAARCSPPSSRSTPCTSTSTATSRPTCATPAGPGARAGPTGGRRGCPVYLGLANESGFPHEGRLDFVDNQVDPASGTIRTRAVFSNRSRALTPGLFARVKLVGTEKMNTALLVRDAAIGTDQDRKFVLVVGPGDTLAYRPIVPGRLTDGLRIVTSGLKPGERIVVNGLMRVRPGMKVAPTLDGHGA